MSETCGQVFLHYNDTKMMYLAVNLFVGVSVLIALIVLLMDVQSSDLREKNMLDMILKIIQLAPWVISGASLICALTPTPKDDQMLGKIYKLIDWCAINIGKAKDK